jgi:hypothetical protein
MDRPEINNRISQLIEYYSNNSVKKFAESIKIPQQTVNRLFNIDKRTNKYPVATTELLVAITEMYVDIDANWLLSGKGQMFREERPTHIPKQANIIELLPPEAFGPSAPSEREMIWQMIRDQCEEIKELTKTNREQAALNHELTQANLKLTTELLNVPTYRPIERPGEALLHH